MIGLTLKASRVVVSSTCISRIRFADKFLLGFLYVSQPAEPLCITGRVFRLRPAAAHGCHFVSRHTYVCCM